MPLEAPPLAGGEDVTAQGVGCATGVGHPRQRGNLWELGNLGTNPAYVNLCADFECHLKAHLRETDDAILDGFVPNKEGKPDTPLWERQKESTYKLHAYNREESSDLPFSEP